MNKKVFVCVVAVIVACITLFFLIPMRWIREDEEAAAKQNKETVSRILKDEHVSFRDHVRLQTALLGGAEKLGIDEKTFKKLIDLDNYEVRFITSTNIVVSSK